MPCLYNNIIITRLCNDESKSCLDNKKKKEEIFHIIYIYTLRFCSETTRMSRILAVSIVNVRFRIESRNLYYMYIYLS